VRALYTLLIAGALARPSVEAKTRFKTWWSLVGWSMEYAAGVSGVTAIARELMRIGEVGDEEATAASAALSILHEIWGGDPFTAGRGQSHDDRAEVRWSVRRADEDDRGAPRPSPTL
jgi:hypothetical protein